MTLGRPWWLAGLLLLVPLVLLHLRRRDRDVTEIASLLVWRDVEAAAAPSSQRRRPPRLWPLLIQAAILALLVGALADPRVPASHPAPTRVLVLDTGLWMSAPGRLARARDALARSASGGRVAVVAAGPTPRVVYEGNGRGAAKALRRLRPQPAPSDLAAALVTAGSLDARSIVLARAPEDPLPRIAAARTVRVATVGGRLDDRALVAPAARCGIGGPTGCEIVAELVNESARPATVSLRAAVAGGGASAFTARVAANGATPVALAVTPRARVTISIETPDALRADDRAFVVVPGPAGTPSSSVVTLVGDPPQALPLARAFGAVPGVSLRLRSRIEFSPADVAASDLVVVDGDQGLHALPDSPAVLLVHPAALDGAAGIPATRPAAVTSTARGDLLAGIDLTALAVDRGAVRRYPLPPWMQPLALADAVPLLAAGSDGRRRVALLAFEPSRSNLPQLDALPVLARNLVTWASAWAPASVAAGRPFVIQWLPRATAARISGAAVRHGANGAAAVPGLAPGNYQVGETQAANPRTVAVAVSLAAPAARSVSLPIGVQGAGSSTRLAWWLAAAALLAIAIELAVGSRRRSG